MTIYCQMRRRQRAAKEETMPSKSQAQQKFMAICEHDPKHAQGKCPSQKVAAEFARTKRAGLPEHVGKKKR